MENKGFFTVRNMAMIGVLAALVFAASWFSFPIVTPIGTTRLHLGNVMCLLSGFLLGPLGGGLAAGLGSMFYDFTFPEYVSEAWITFIMKFAMTWLCGMLSRNIETKSIRRRTIAAISGAALYVVLYSLKNFLHSYYFMQMELTPVLVAVGTKALVSLTNGVIAVICAVPLSMAVHAALSRAHLSHNLKPYSSHDDI